MYRVKSVRCHFSPFNTPTTTSFLLHFSHSIPFHNTHAMPSFNTLSLHICVRCLVCLDRKSEGQVWDSPCQTHCAPHPIHTTLFPSNHAPFSNEHMVDWFMMHQSTFHPSIVLCPLLMHKPFPPHSCFAIPFHHGFHHEWVIETQHTHHKQSIHA